MERYLTPFSLSLLFCFLEFSCFPLQIFWLNLKIGLLYVGCAPLLAYSVIIIEGKLDKIKWDLGCPMWDFGYSTGSAGFFFFFFLLISQVHLSCYSFFLGGYI